MKNESSAVPQVGSSISKLSSNRTSLPWQAKAAPGKIDRAAITARPVRRIAASSFRRCFPRLAAPPATMESNRTPLKAW